LGGGGVVIASFADDLLAEIDGDFARLDLDE
jgi:hypothetical protein